MQAHPPSPGIWSALERGAQKTLGHDMLLFCCAAFKRMKALQPPLSLSVFSPGVQKRLAFHDADLALLYIQEHLAELELPSVVWVYLQELLLMPLKTINFNAFVAEQPTEPSQSILAGTLLALYHRWPALQSKHQALLHTHIKTRLSVVYPETNFSDIQETVDSLVQTSFQQRFEGLLPSLGPIMRAEPPAVRSILQGLPNLTLEEIGWLYFVTALGPDTPMLPMLDWHHPIPPLERQQLLLTAVSKLPRPELMLCLYQDLVRADKLVAMQASIACYISMIAPFPKISKHWLLFKLLHLGESWFLQLESSTPSEQAKLNAIYTSIHNIPGLSDNIRAYLEGLQPTQQKEIALTTSENIGRLFTRWQPIERAWLWLVLKTDEPLQEFKMIDTGTMEHHTFFPANSSISRSGFIPTGMVEDCLERVRDHPDLRAAFLKTLESYSFDEPKEKVALRQAQLCLSHWGDQKIRSLDIGAKRWLYFSLISRTQYSRVPIANKFYPRPTNQRQRLTTDQLSYLGQAVDGMLPLLREKLERALPSDEKELIRSHLAIMLQAWTTHSDRYPALTPDATLWLSHRLSSKQHTARDRKEYYQINSHEQSRLAGLLHLLIQSPELSGPLRERLHVLIAEQGQTHLEGGQTAFGKLVLNLDQGTQVFAVLPNEEASDYYAHWCWHGLQSAQQQWLAYHLSAGLAITDNFPSHHPHIQNSHLLLPLWALCIRWPNIQSKLLKLAGYKDITPLPAFTHLEFNKVDCDPLLKELIPRLLKYTPALKSLSLVSHSIPEAQAESWAKALMEHPTLEQVSLGEARSSYALYQQLTDSCFALAPGMKWKMVAHALQERIQDKETRIWLMAVLEKGTLLPKIRTVRGALIPNIHGLFSENFLTLPLLLRLSFADVRIRRYMHEVLGGKPKQFQAWKMDISRLAEFKFPEAINTQLIAASEQGDAPIVEIPLEAQKTVCLAYASKTAKRIASDNSETKTAEKKARSQAEP